VWSATQVVQSIRGIRGARSGEEKGASGIDLTQ
jgi:hypothetical protein